MGEPNLPLKQAVATWAPKLGNRTTFLKLMLSVVLCLLLQFQVRKSIVSLLVVLVVDALVRTGHFACVLPVHKRVLVAVSPPEAAPRIVVRGHHHLVLTVSHDNSLSLEGRVGLEPTHNGLTATLLCH